MLRKRSVSAIPRQSLRRAVQRRLCAWCGRDLGPMAYRSAAPSYSICDDCVECNFSHLYGPEQAPPTDPELPAKER